MYIRYLRIDEDIVLEFRGKVLVGEIYFGVGGIYMRCKFMRWVEVF